jgi:RNA polymerase sigma factor (TIGR02999 family)
MPDAGRGEITRMSQLFGNQSGDVQEETDRLFQLVYRELRQIAIRLMRRERSDHTLQPTALVNEAYLRLIERSAIAWEDRAQFLRVASCAMRRVLVDHARRRLAAKRGGKLRRVTLGDEFGASGGSELDILVLDDALHRLSRLDERMGRVVELRIFAGMEMDEIANVLVVSRRTVYDDWHVARKWLGREMAQESA